MALLPVKGLKDLIKDTKGLGIKSTVPCIQKHQ